MIDTKREEFGASRAFGSTNRVNKLPIITKFHRKLRPFEFLKWTRAHCLHARTHRGGLKRNFFKGAKIRGPPPPPGRVEASVSANFDL